MFGLDCGWPFDRPISSAIPYGWQNIPHIFTTGIVRLISTGSINIQARMWFQHVGTPPHLSLDMRSTLDAKFPGQWIGQCGPTTWLARSPDLSCLDFSLWSQSKSLRKPHWLRRGRSCQNFCCCSCSLRNVRCVLKREPLATSSCNTYITAGYCSFQPFLQCFHTCCQ